MSEYRLPEGMTAEKLRELADDPVANKVHAALHDWADAIDPPEPESVVTDEMIDEVADEVGWVGWGDVKQVLEAVERLGWLRDLESDADNPSSSGEPWPTDEQALAAAKALCAAVKNPIPWESSPTKEWWIGRARVALEAVAPPPVSDDVTDRLAMAEGLLRRVTIEAMVWESTGGVPVNGGGWWVGSKDWPNESHKVNVAADEAEYLRSLNGEGE